MILPWAGSFEITARLAPKSATGAEIISPISDEFTYPLTYVSNEMLGEKAYRYAANLGLADGIADSAHLQRAAAIRVVAADASVRKVRGQPDVDDNIDGMLQQCYGRIGLYLTSHNVEAELRDAHQILRHTTWPPIKGVAEHIITTASAPRYRRYHAFHGVILWNGRTRKFPARLPSDPRRPDVPEATAASTAWSMPHRAWSQSRRWLVVMSLRS